MKRLLSTVIAFLVAVAVCGPAEAARPRRPSAAQVKKMQDQAKYMQQEVLRYQSEMAAKEREFYLSFDENRNGRLEGGRKSPLRQAIARHSGRQRAESNRNHCSHWARAKRLEGSRNRSVTVPEVTPCRAVASRRGRGRG